MSHWGKPNAAVRAGSSNTPMTSLRRPCHTHLVCVVHLAVPEAQRVHSLLRRCTHGQVDVGVGRGDVSEGGEARHAAGEEEDLAGANVVVAQSRLNVLFQDDPEEVWGVGVESVNSVTGDDVFVAQRCLDVLLQDDPEGGSVDGISVNNTGCATGAIVVISQRRLVVLLQES